MVAWARMRIVASQHLAAGAQLAHALYDGPRVMLAAGTLLTDALIGRLREAGFDSVVIQTHGDWPVWQPVAAGLYEGLIQWVDQLLQDGKLQPRELREWVQRLLDALAVQRPEAPYFARRHQPARMRAAHTVDATILAVAAALRARYPIQAIDDLAAGMLVRDVGYSQLPAAVLAKTGPLSPSEREMIRFHPKVPWERYRDQISPLSRLVALQHHERHDGSGYPDGLKGDDIHPLARLAAVADTFDALRSERPHRPPFPLLEVRRHLHQESGKTFHEEAVSQFFQGVPTFAHGQTVRLTDGRDAVVVGNGYSSRPSVQPLPAGEQVDLSQSLTLAIADIL